MYKNQMKSIIGENCNGYEARYESSKLRMGGPFSNSCDNCINFSKGQCKKDLYDYMEGIIKFN